MHIGIVDLLALFTYETHTKKNHVFLYSSVKASQAMTEVKEVWIAIHKKKSNQKSNFMCLVFVYGSAYKTCNHVIACLYKVDFANTKGFCNPSCAEQVCA